MAWFKVDDKFHSHPKVLTVPLKSIGLWVKAGAWASDQLTDGHVPKGALPILGGTLADAKKLVEAGLWETTSEGFRFHDWEEMNPSRADVEANRQTERERKAEWRTKKAQLKLVREKGHASV